MTKTRKQYSKFIVFSVILLLIASVIYVGFSRFNAVPHIIAALIQGDRTEAFPDIDSSKLSEEQLKIVQQLKQEFASQPDGIKYSDGISEPWGANFVSWIMNSAGYPLRNPHSDSWRIAGTDALREYYESVGRFHGSNSGYVPKVGDIMLYDNPSSFGQHTNVVIKNDDGVITTIGGDEPGGIRIFTHTTKDTIGFIGYGSLK